MVLVLSLKNTWLLNDVIFSLLNSSNSLNVKIKTTVESKNK